MSVISCDKDPAALTMTVIAEFDAEPAEVWQVWEDPRQLEKWWGPPSCPATFTRHDFVVGGQSRYSMDVPDGSVPRGYWVVRLLDKPHRIEFDNGLAGDDGEPVNGVEPMGGEVSFEAIPTGTRMTVLTRYLDLAQMEQMISMQMVEGMLGAIGQIDSLLDAAKV